MSLPDGFLDDLRTRVSLSQVAGRKVTWDSKKSNQAKGDMWAPCPFHQEKTASFHVDDQKGFYYCFGCHAKGNAFSFVQETENVGFMEAVEILAREAGIAMPARDPRAAAKADRNKELADIMEQAVQFYRMQLNSAAAGSARDYLVKRGLPKETIEKFEMGFAPNGRDALTKALLAKGIAMDKLVLAGLTGKPDDGRSPFDRFRNRIIFPIRDPRGRCIAFGGRAMDPNDRAKYLNSPETPLFDKGRSLYHHAPAREAAGKANRLIVAEGYMDVIALDQAGISEAVAPLGTAITADQLQLLWRIHPEPIIALDGDTAGIRAAMRLLDLALPLIEPGKALRFCIMPEGQDPDDLLKSKGKAGMEALLNASMPMVDLLWRRETEGQNFDSPERRATLDQALKAAIFKIKDPSIRGHYGQAIADLRRSFFNIGAPTPNAPRSNFSPRPYKTNNNQARAKTKASLLGQTDNAGAILREAVILAAAILNPAAARKEETRLEMLPITTDRHIGIRAAILAHLSDDEDQMRSAIADELGEDPLVALRKLPRVASHPFLNSTASADNIARTLTEELEKHFTLSGMNDEIEDAVRDLEGDANEGVTFRLKEANAARRKVYQTSQDDQNASEKEAALSADLQSMLDKEIWKKQK